MILENLGSETLPCRSVLAQPAGECRDVPALTNVLHGQTGRAALSVQLCILRPHLKSTVHFTDLMILFIASEHAGITKSFGDCSPLQHALGLML